MHALLSVVVFLAAPQLSEHQYPGDDAAGISEYPGLPRVPGMALPHGSERDRGAWSFVLAKGKKRVEGHVWYLVYSLKNQEGEMPPLEALVEHYRKVVEKKGGSLVFQKRYPGDQVDTMRATYKMPAGTGETWIGLEAADISYSLMIASTDPQIPRVSITADHLARTIARGGYITLYNILFEKEKDVFKPETEPVLKEIAAYLKKEPALRLQIEAFHDLLFRGTKEPREWYRRTQALTQKRADAVKAWLTSKGGIDAGRLVAVGGDQPGYRCPEDPADNERIRLVKK